MATSCPIYQIILTVLQHSGHLEPGAVPGPDTALREGLGLDSLGLIRLVLGLNEALGIEIRAVELVPQHFATLGSLERLLQQKCQGIKG